MVTAELILRPGETRRVHWPNYASVEMVQLRICKALRRDWKQVQAVIVHGGRELFEFERPWLWMDLPRHSSVQVDVRFESLAAEEIAAFEWASGDDGDESDGCTTSSAIAEHIESIGF